MKIDGVHYRSIWRDRSGRVMVIDQRWLPHDLRIAALETEADFSRAISEMWVRGAPLIGATAAHGVAAEMARDPSDAALAGICERLHATRPTAINLRWALDDMRTRLGPLPPAERAAAATARADAICDEDVAINRTIGAHGLEILRGIAARKGGGRVNVLTHCNAGWLATVDWGTATSPIYQAIEAGIDVHVFADETRPRNQGAALTAWEMASHGVSHDVIVDNAGGHLMQAGEVDVVITGTDRVVANGDVANKIGTYLKALAARDNAVPMYIALPSPTIDWATPEGGAIPIEERDAHEVTHVQGLTGAGDIGHVRITPAASPARNPAFDVTPARLITGLITEKGICDASAGGLAGLFPDRAA